jgi:type VI secretion system secreted protein Hcp
MRNRVLMVGALVLGLVAVGSGESYAQSFRTFMFVPGVPGDSTDAQHPNWIDVLSLSQGATSSRKAVACSDVSVSKFLDRSGPALWAAAATGQVFAEIHLEIVKGGDSPVVIYDIRLNNAKVMSTQTSSSSELPMESVSFSLQSITLTFNKQSPTGGIIPGTPQTIACQ